MKTRELSNLGITEGAAMHAAKAADRDALASGMDFRAIKQTIKGLLGDPHRYANDPIWGDLASIVARQQDAFVPRESSAPWKQWGQNLDTNAVEQMTNAADLPIAVRGALMPDAHMGYGLPIGGVLATDNAIIPYAVGVDIACRMKLTVLDLPVSAFENEHDRLKDALCRETLFGVGGAFRAGHRKQHPVMDANWRVSPVTANGKDKAHAQLGTSGSGNHFVEFGTLTLDAPDLGLDAGTYLAVLSHSGSRGTGSDVADHYSKLAMRMHPELPKALRHLAWFDLNSSEGQEYFRAMQLMGQYASANHELIHDAIARHLKVNVLADIENHHNFAWIERHDGRDVVVHRKGATPASHGTLAIIPGSMASPGFVVRGKGCDAALHSASHGAGRKMSRKAAFQKFTWEQAHAVLAEAGVELLSAGLDEVPMAYKDIHEVMSHQRDLVDVVARFDPKMVRMARSESHRRR